MNHTIVNPEPSVGYTMRIKEQCAVRYDELRQCFRVDIGIAVVHYGTLFSCEEWARLKGIPIRNQSELNRIKYNNMPAWEGLA